MDIYNDVAQGIKPRASFTGTQQAPNQANQASFTRTSAGNTNNFGYLVTRTDASKPTGGMTSLPAAKPEAPPSMDAVNGLISDVSSRAQGLTGNEGEQIDAAMEGAQAGGPARMSPSLSATQFGGIQRPQGPPGQGSPTMIQDEEQGGLNA